MRSFRTQGYASTDMKDFALKTNTLIGSSKQLHFPFKSYSLIIPRTNLPTSNILKSLMLISQVANKNTVAELQLMSYDGYISVPQKAKELWG